MWKRLYWERVPRWSGEGNGTPLQYSCLKNPMDRGAWWAAVHGVAKSRTRLSDFTFTFHFPALEKEMATHSSVLAWRIPGKGEPGGLPSMGSHRVRHDWSDLSAAAAERNGKIFLVHKLKEQLLLKCPSTVEWINKMWYIHIMECHLAIKKNKVLIYRTIWIN